MTLLSQIKIALLILLIVILISNETYAGKKAIQQKSKNKQGNTTGIVKNQPKARMHKIVAIHKITNQNNEAKKEKKQLKSSKPNHTNNAEQKNPSLKFTSMSSVQLEEYCFKNCRGTKVPQKIQSPLAKRRPKRDTDDEEEVDCDMGGCDGKRKPGYACNICGNCKNYYY